MWRWKMVGKEDKILTDEEIKELEEELLVLKQRIKEIENILGF
jgi:hypothetical protein